MRVQIWLAVLVLALIGGAAQAQATITVGSLQLNHCGEPRIYCGSLTRPFGAATIEGFFEYVPAEGEPTGTLVAAEGGPGFPTTGSAASYLGLFRPILAGGGPVLVGY